MTDTTLFSYRCRNCETVMTTPAKGKYRCNACYGAMDYLFSTPIETEEDRKLAALGPVYNAGVKRWTPLCPWCDGRVSQLYGVTREGIRFCSTKCADLWAREASA